MTRWLGVDHGSKRIGIAAGDEADRVVTPVTVLSAGPVDRLAEEIAHLLRDYACTGIVVGWPINMDDTEGPQGQAARTFASKLAESLEADVRLWDERLSSFQADRALAGHLTRQKRRRRQDAVAAAAILEDFLNNDGPIHAPKPADAQVG